MNDSFRRKLNTSEASDYTGLSKIKLEKFRMRGGGPAYLKLGSRVVYDPSDLDAWLSKHKRTSTTAAAA